MIFEHICGRSMLVIDDRSYNHQSRWDKPDGLWLSVKGSDPDWREWCAMEQFYTFKEPVGYVHQVDVDLSNVLILDSYEKLKGFHKTFSGAGTIERNRVKWDIVARHWKGIVIAPYQWRARLSYIGWYYGWDCGSACIWDTSIVSNPRLVETFHKQPQEMLV